MRPALAHRWLLTVALALGATPLLAQDWAGTGRIQGNVTDEESKPIVGAKVTLHSPKDPNVGPAPLVTDKKGHWAYLGLDGGNWTVTIDAEGYVSAEGPWPVSQVGAAKPLNVKLKKITEEMLEAAKPKPNPVALAVEQGNDLLRANQPAQARAEYEKALAAVTDPPTKVIVLRAIAQCYQAESNHDKAIETLNQALEIAPGDADTEKLLAISLYQTKKTDQAIALLKDLFEKNPSDAAVGQTLVSFLIEAGHEDEANSYVARLPQGIKVDSASMLNIGIRHYNESRLPQALDAFNKVIEAYPDLADGYYYRGLTRLALNQMPAAREDFKKVLELAPGTEHAKDAQEFLKY